MCAYANRRTSGVLVRTRMPEFHYEYSVSLEKPLRRMGVRQAFSDGADFSGLTDDPVCLDAILHKTYINLNKNGTEAAAVTAVIVKAGSVRPPEQLEEKQVYLDRPFVYAIVDTQTGLPLFLGVVSRV
jgi:serpin B